MKKLLKWIYLVAAVMMLSSCGMFDGKGSLDYIPAKEDSDDKWGMVGPDGKMLFSDEFENEPSAVINGYFAVEEDEGYSVYKADKRPELVKGLEGLTSVGAMSEGVMPICRKGKRIEYVNGKGET